MYINRDKILVIVFGCIAFVLFLSLILMIIDAIQTQSRMAQIQYVELICNQRYTNSIERFVCFMENSLITN